MNYLINEIFYSIQGEGWWAGTPCLFVRFQTCNLQCEFCDTKRVAAVSLSEKTIVNILSALSSCTRVVLTGGEPFYQDYLFPLIDYLKGCGYTIHIESNGTLLPSKPIPLVWTTLSPKSVISIPRWVNEVKWLVGDGKELWNWTSDIPGPLHYLQPVWDRNPDVYYRNLHTCIYLVKEHPNRFRLSTQQHKTWRVR